jgi:hypothetical protein
LSLLSIPIFGGPQKQRTEFHSDGKSPITPRIKWRAELLGVDDPALPRHRDNMTSGSDPFDGSALGKSNPFIERAYRVRNQWSIQS